MDGLIVPPGQGRKLTTKAQDVTFKVTEAHGSFVSSFEVVVPPGFDVGAHVHNRSGEFFYVLSSVRAPAAACSCRPDVRTRS